MSNLIKQNGMTTFKDSSGNFQYPEFWELYKQLDSMHWRASEINLSQELKDYKNANDKEKDDIAKIMQLFTQNEVMVFGYGYNTMLRIFKPLEVQAWLSKAQSSEITHIEAYSLFTETIGLPVDIYTSFLDIPVMATKTEYLDKAKVFKYEDYKRVGMTDAQVDNAYRRSIARMLAVYAGATELISLMAQFAMLMQFQFQGKYPGLVDIVIYSIKEEQLHGRGNCLLFRTFIEENPDIWDDSLKFDIYEAIREVVSYEDALTDYINPAHISIDKLKQYTRFCADNALMELGMKPNYNIGTNPLPFMDDITGVVLADFFSSTVSEYSKDIEGTWGDVTYEHWKEQK